MLNLKLQYFGHLMWRVDSLERPWCWEGLGAGGEGDGRGWDGWMASTRWIWVWVISSSWWWTGRPGVLRFTGSQRVTELNWTEWCCLRLKDSSRLAIWKARMSDPMLRDRIKKILKRKVFVNHTISFWVNLLKTDNHVTLVFYRVMFFVEIYWYWNISKCIYLWRLIHNCLTKVNYFKTN